MSPRIIFLIFFLSISCALAATVDVDIDPGVPACGFISTTDNLTYSINIGPDTSIASFALVWRYSASKINLNLQTPSGEWIKPERDSSATYKESNTSKTYLIERPIAGRWIMKIIPGNQQTANEDYCITAHLVNIKREISTQPNLADFSATMQQMKIKMGSTTT